MPPETSENNNEPIEVFISYSWTNDEYIDWVRELAEELMQNGVLVHLDQWSLKEGDDKFVYMESMVTNPKIKKVIILCDKRYQEKADDRAGGVGTESTIIAPKIYEDVKERAGKQKFIPVITKRYDKEGNEDLDGKEYMPAFIAGRKYVDFSNENHRAENMEQLIRTIYEKPLRVPPPIGKTPSYITNDNRRTNLGTSARFTRAIQLVRNEKPQALEAVKEYFSTLSENMKVFDLEDSSKVTTDNIIERIQEMASMRDEFVDLVEAITRYSSDLALYTAIHDFFESIISYLDIRRIQGVRSDWASDHYRFVIYEIFIYTIAAILKHRRFSEINELTTQGYYLSEDSGFARKGELVSYLTFDTYSYGLDYYNKQLDRKYYSIYSKFVRDRANRADIKMIDLMQADFFLFILSHLHPIPDNAWRSNWYPELLSSGEWMERGFEVFVRSASKRFFEQFRHALGEATKEDLENLSKEFHEGKRSSPQVGGFSRDPSSFMNIDKIATTP